MLNQTLKSAHNIPVEAESIDNNHGSNTNVLAFKSANQAAQWREHDITFSIITSADTPISKSFGLNDRHELVKKAGGQITRGLVEKRSVKNLVEFNDLLHHLNPDQCLCYGIPSNLHQSSFIFPRQALGSYQSNDPDIDVISRTKDFFKFESRPGFLFCDNDPYEPDCPVLSRVDLRNILIDVCPELRSAPMLIRDSVSTFIVNQETGQVIKGEGGKRVYIPVKDASDIPRFAEALVNRLWLRGYGYYAVSKSGRLLERTIFDTSVWSPERLDFVAGALCEPPLLQTQHPSTFIHSDNPPFDTATMRDLDGSDLQRVQRLKHQAMEAKAREAGIVREDYVQKSAFRLSQKCSRSVNECKLIIGKSLDEKPVLSRDFILYLSDGQEVTVREVLNDPLYIGKTLRDPVEPDYNHNSTVAKIMTDNNTGKIFIHSFAHGGKVYSLESRLIIEFRTNMNYAAEQCLKALNDTHSMFFMGGKDPIVRLYQDNNRNIQLENLSVRSLHYYLNESVDLVKVEKNSKTGEIQNKEMTIPKPLLEMIVGISRHHLPLFHGFSSVPVIRSDFSWCSQQGYDAETGYYVLGKEITIIDHPTQEQMMEAFQRIRLPTSPNLLIKSI